MFCRHTTQDGTKTFLTKKMFKSDLSDPGVSSELNAAASNQNATDPIEPTNG